MDPLFLLLLVPAFGAGLLVHSIPRHLPWRDLERRTAIVEGRVEGLYRELVTLKAASLRVVDDEEQPA